MNTAPKDTPRVIAHHLAAGGAIPNHPRWPLLVYPGVVAIAGADPAAAFEALFDRNRWPAAWRNGVFPFHHFHTNAHEVLGVYSGEVTVQFGGDGGVVVTAQPGDVIVLPAGTGHKKLSSRGALGVVGRLPGGPACRHVHAVAVRTSNAAPMPWRASRSPSAIRSTAPAGRSSRTGRV